MENENVDVDVGGATMPPPIEVDEGGQAGAGKVFELMRDIQVLLVESPADLFCSDLVSQCWPFQLAQPGRDPTGLVRPNMGVF